MQTTKQLPNARIVSTIRTLPHGTPIYFVDINQPTLENQNKVRKSKSIFTNWNISKCYFLWDNAIWNLPISGPFGLSVMVVLSECSFQNLEKHSIELVLTFGIDLKRFVDM